MTSDDLTFISFEPRNSGFVAFISIGWLLSDKEDAETIMRRATTIYQEYIVGTRLILAEVQTARSHRQLVPARKIWRVGDALFILVSNLEKLSFKLDGFYEHLSRDLNVKRKWLEKVIILRRYIPQEAIIPEALGWGYFEKGTRRKAQELLRTLR